MRKFEARHGVKVNVDLYDSNEAMLAKVQAGNAGYDVVCPSDYPVEVLRKQNLLQRLDHSALPNLRNLDPHFLDRAYDPGNGTPCRISGAPAESLTAARRWEPSTPGRRSGTPASGGRS